MKYTLGVGLHPETGEVIITLDTLESYLDGLTEMGVHEIEKRHLTTIIRHVRRKERELRARARP